jgi:hypothetical protein
MIDYTSDLAERNRQYGYWYGIVAPLATYVNGATTWPERSEWAPSLLKLVHKRWYRTDRSSVSERSSWLLDFSAGKRSGWSTYNFYQTPLTQGQLGFVLECQSLSLLHSICLVLHSVLQIQSTRSSISYHNEARLCLLLGYFWSTASSALHQPLIPLARTARSLFAHRHL